MVVIRPRSAAAHVSETLPKLLAGSGEWVAVRARRRSAIVVRRVASEGVVRPETGRRGARGWTSGGPGAMRTSTTGERVRVWVGRGGGVVSRLIGVSRPASGFG
jgi:hypothetical protein